MTDAQKIKIIDKIISTAYEFVPPDEKSRSGYYEGVINALYAVLNTEDGGDNNA